MGLHPSKRPLRVGHLLTSLWPGGIEQFVLSLATALPSSQFETRVYSWMDDNPWIDQFRSRGISVQASKAPNRCGSPKDFARLAKAWLELAYRLRRDKIDILHTHDFLPSLMGRTASIAAGVPSRVATLHNLYDWWPRWVYPVNRVLAHRTDAITCVSESVRRFMIEHEGLPPERYLTILNGVDEKRFHPDPIARREMRQELGLSDKDILVGSVGSITTRKAQWILAQGAAPLLREGLPVQFRIWGANGSNPQHAENELVSIVRELGIGDNFRLLPPRKDIERVYNAMDIHCMTSIAEGLSLASVEAMMCGVVPVYSDIGPFTEVVTDQVNGFLFQSGSPTSLGNTLKKCVELLREGSLPGVAEQARTSASTRFSMARVVKEWSDLYSGLKRRS